MKKNLAAILYLPVCFLLFWSHTVYAQNHVLTGRVIDKNSKPLTGAAVKIKASDKATSTNAQGIFSFDNVPANSARLIRVSGKNKELKSSVAISTLSAKQMAQLTPPARLDLSCYFLASSKK